MVVINLIYCFIINYLLYRSDLWKHVVIPLYVFLVLLLTITKYRDNINRKNRSNLPRSRLKLFLGFLLRNINILSTVYFILFACFIKFNLIDEFYTLKYSGTLISVIVTAAIIVRGMYYIPQ